MGVIRISAAFVLAAGLAGLAACASKPPAEKPSDEAVKCMAYLGLQKAAAPADAARLDAASANWKTIALVTMSGNQVDQYYANSIAAYGGQPADQIRAAADRCLRRKPGNKPLKR